MIMAALNLAHGDVVALHSGILTGVHLVAQCSGHHCWVHNSSQHHMTTWPINWRYDTYTAQRLCPRGIGHPDPDDVAYNASIGMDVSVHECDGCCAASA